ncbi:hypothetical protein [Arthrobacter sp. CJ23]|uniref:hypothetical protein n=1 Tax=Arthrobacter sp. CJ23 TaxID=2972479 RepID=UPI00215B7768|nr:hypothetical protein [Arthrobacter sp. CJ23]UVJ41285.1 hypothetical protein NVV90_09150 [Arthrobacter sp. CJ23]
MIEPMRAPVEPLKEALEGLRLEGAIFLRAEYTEGWALEGQGGPVFAAVMHPGAERLILFPRRRVRTLLGFARRR